MPRWHTCGQSSHQKPKQLSGRSSYSYSSRDSCRLFGVEMAWPVFSHKLPWSAWAEAPEATRISDIAPKKRTIRPALRGFKDDPKASKERTTMGQRPLKNSFQFRPLLVLPLRGSRTTPKLLRRGHSHPLIRGPLIFFDAPNKERTKSTYWVAKPPNQSCRWIYQYLWAIIS